MNRQHILDEIRRTAVANGGGALGVQRFYTETGIKESDWRGRFWARWGDALLEAGFSPNEFTPRIEDSLLIEKLIELTPPPKSLASFKGLDRSLGCYARMRELPQLLAPK